MKWINLFETLIRWRSVTIDWRPSGNSGFSLRRERRNCESSVRQSENFWQHGCPSRNNTNVIRRRNPFADKKWGRGRERERKKNDNNQRWQIARMIDTTWNYKDTPRFATSSSRQFLPRGSCLSRNCYNSWCDAVSEKRCSIAAR